MQGNQSGNRSAGDLYDMRISSDRATSLSEIMGQALVNMQKNGFFLADVCTDPND